MFTYSMCSSLSVFHEFLLVLTEGCKFQEECVYVCVWVVMSGQLGLFSPLKSEPSPGRPPHFFIDRVSKDSLVGPLLQA